MHAVTAVESALLDLLGQHLGVPVAALLGDGQQRDRVQTLGYLFFVGDRTRTDLAYRSASDEAADADDWLRLRHEEALTPDAIVRLAEAARERYGFRDFKLKGGVLPAPKRSKPSPPSPTAFPKRAITLDPNGAWSLAEAIRRAASCADVLAYAEDPVRRRKRLLRPRDHGRIPPRHRPADRHQHDRDRLAPDWATRSAAVAVDIPLADPHFWTMQGSVRVAQLCDDVGSDLGLALEQPLRRFAGDVHPRRRRGAGQITAIDTHWIWQDGQRLTASRCEIVGGISTCPTRPALASSSTWTRSKRRTSCTSEGLGARDDAVAMQYLVQAGHSTTNALRSSGIRAHEDPRRRPQSGPAPGSVRGGSACRIERALECRDRNRHPAGRRA